MISILFVHQSADLYGSDRVLLALLKGLDRMKFRPTVVLPIDGPLRLALDELGVESHVIPLALVGRRLLGIRGLLAFPLEIWGSFFSIKSVIDNQTIDIVHSNTLAVISGAAWAWLSGKPHVWHVHEIIEHPVAARKGFAWLLRVFATRVVCNSSATLNLLLKDQPRLERKATVVWNGINRTQPVSKECLREFRSKLGIKGDEVLIALVGRINGWKGHSLLIDAAEQIEPGFNSNFHYVFVGSAPAGQEHFLHSLRNRIGRSSVKEKLHLLPFTHDIWTVWDACDIAVVPSIEPEPFGMVALEAMASEKPVIAADHGGLAEIVAHGETGLLFEPRNAQALAVAIERLGADKSLRQSMGKSGKHRAAEVFSERKYIDGLVTVYAHVQARR